MEVNTSRNYHNINTYCSRVVQIMSYNNILALFFEVLIWSRPYRLYGILGTKIKATIVWDSLGVCKCSFAAKCITAITFGLLEALINLSFVGFHKLGFFLAGSQNMGVHMCFVSMFHRTCT
jgi:hypothetical protein